MIKKFKHSQKFYQKRLKTITKQIEDLREERDKILSKYYKLMDPETLEILKNKIKQESKND